MGALYVLGLLIRLPIFLVLFVVITPFYLVVLLFWCLLSLALFVSVFIWLVVAYPVWIVLAILLAALVNNWSLLKGLGYPTVVKAAVTTVPVAFFNLIVERTARFSEWYSFAFHFLLYGLSED